MAARWITFDCYGTLVDWQSGFVAILKTIAAERTGDLLEAYHRNEPKVEAERPFRGYKQVLEISLLRAASEVGIQLTQEQARSLPSQWSRLPVFGDVEEALSQLRSAGYKLGVLTNCDEDLFAQTQRSFKQPFDLVCYCGAGEGLQTEPEPLPIFCANLWRATCRLGSRGLQ